MWSLLLCLLLLALQRRMSGLRALLRRPARLASVALAGVLIAVNWALFLLAATTGRITDAALGYFLNPLVSVALGLLVLGERLRPAQAAAVVIGALGGISVGLGSGEVPWIALGLAFSFGFYGLLKNRIGMHLGAVESLTAETAVLTPFALAGIVWMSSAGVATFGNHGWGHGVLLAMAGVVTAIPLLLFAGAARRVSLVAIGLMQFVAPVLQLLTGLALGEPMSTGRWIGFGVVWIALLVLVSESLWRTLRRRRGRSAHRAGSTAQNA